LTDTAYVVVPSLGYLPTTDPQGVQSVAIAHHSQPGSQPAHQRLFRLV